MGYLFLDIETYGHPENKASGLNPHHDSSKVIVVAYNYYPGFKSPRKESLKPPIFLKEWELGEKKMLSDFYSYLRSLVATDLYFDAARGEERCSLKVVGFNVAKFDLPYLFGRLKHHNIAPERELFDIVFTKPLCLDLYHMTPLVSHKTKKYSELWALGQKEANERFGLPVKEGRGDELSRFYDKGEYAKIIKYCTEEFTFEQLYEALLMHALENGEGENAVREMQ